MTGITEGGKKTAAGGSGNPDKASPVAVENYIKGIKFPADKGELIKQEENNRAPDDVLHVMNKFEDKEYHSPIDISKEIGKLH